MLRIDAFGLCLVSRVLLLALLISWLAAAACPATAAPDDVDIDYSHNVIGTGTVMTDFKMGSTESTEVSGRVRGSGEVLNEYIFSSNNSENVSIEDRFLFTRAPDESLATSAGYPRMDQMPGAFQLLGTAWANSINLSSLNLSANASIN